MKMAHVFSLPGWWQAVNLMAALALGAGSSGCSGKDDAGPPPDTAPEVEDTEAAPLTDCDPALSLDPGESTVNAHALVQLHASGGTGAWVFTLSDDASGASLNGGTGAYIAGDATGGADAITLTDDGCLGEATATVSVVDGLEVTPAAAWLVPGGTVRFDVAGGSGEVACALFTDSSGGEVATDCTLTAGASEGVDRVVFEDQETGELVYITVEVSEDAVFAVAGAGRVFMPEWHTFAPTSVYGSGVLDVEVLDGDFSVEDGAVVAGAAGQGTVRVTDRYTGDAAEIPVVALAPFVPDAGRDGERTVSGTLRNLGDVDGDGYDDAALAYIEPSVGAYYSGAVVVYAGGPDGLEAEAVQVFSGDTPEDTFGRDVASGDVDGDGVIDLVIGADRVDRGATNNGAVTIYLGIDGAFFEEEPSRSLFGENEYDRMGSSLALCDFDGDGWLDLAAGALDAANLAVAVPADEQGAIHVFRGSADGFPDQADFILYGQLPGDEGWEDVKGMHLGTSLAAGDLDGDGLCDLAAGTHEIGADGSGSDGVVVIYAGTLDDDLLLTREPVAILAGDDGEDEEFGRRVAVADIDGDGAAELAVGAWRASVDASAGGAVYIFEGGEFPSSATSVRWASDADWAVHGTHSSHYLGSDVDLRDLDDDGLADLVVGAYRGDAGGNEAGEVRVYAGDAIADDLDGHDASDDDPWVVALGALAGDRLGQAAVGLRDVDGDGWPELAALAGYDDTYGVEVGAPYAVLGATGDTTLLDLPGEAAGHQFGQGFSLFDVNGDGLADLVMGGSGVGVEGIGANAGAVYAYLGSDDGPAGDAEAILGGHPTHSGSDRFGWSVADAGDFDGDGYDDLAVVARKDSRPTTFSSTEYANSSECPGFISQAGAMFLYLGGAEGVSETPSFVTFGFDETEYIYEVRGGFDHDGDGYDDLAVSSWAWDGNRGGLAIVYGRPVDPDGITVLCEREELIGLSTYDFLGMSLAVLGDLDGDGCDELVVGASGEEFHSDWYNQGVVRVLWGWGGAGCREAPEVTSMALKVVSAEAGTSLDAGKDVDGDGLPDLVVGAVAYRRYFAEYGAAWLVPGWYLLELPTDEIVDGALPDLDETAFSLMLPGDGLLDRYGVVGTVAGGLFGAAVALIEDPLDPTRAALAVGAPQGDVGGVALAGGVAIWRFDDDDGDGVSGFDEVPWALVGGETAIPGGDLGALLLGTEIGGAPALIIGAPLSDASGGMDAGAVYIARFE